MRTNYIQKIHITTKYRTENSGGVGFYCVYSRATLHIVRYIQITRHKEVKTLERSSEVAPYCSVALVGDDEAMKDFTSL